MPIKVRKRRIITFISIIFIGTFFTIFILSSNFWHHLANKSPLVEEGIFDFNKGKVKDNKINYLVGDWYFTYGQWIVTDQETANLDDLHLVKVPHSWVGENLANNKKATGKGYGSYKVTLINYPENTKMAFNLDGLRGAYRIFIKNSNDTTYQKIAENEILNKNGTNSYTRATLGLLSHDEVTFTGTSCEIVIEMSCIHSGGLDAAPFMASKNRIHTYNVIKDGAVFMFIGALVAVGFIFILRLKIEGYEIISRDIVILVVLLFISALLGHPSFAGIQDFFLKISFERAFIINFVVFYIIIAMSVKIICHFMGNIITTKRIIVYDIYYMSLILLTVIFWYTNILDWEVIILVILSMLPIIQIIICLFNFYIYKQDDYSLGYLLGLLLILSGLTLNILSINGLIYFDVDILYYSFLVLACMILSIVQSKKVRKLSNDAKEAERLKIELAQSNSNLLLQQIKPHFIYNTLNTIKYLCRTNPMLAEKTILKFSKFLRTNIDKISTNELIPFDEELENCQNYCSIEELRFGERLKMVYEIRTTNFLIPPLTIQPLVENAIKHGIMKKIEGGTIIIKTFEDEEFNYIEIIDDGIGFEAGTLSTSHLSVGLTNVIKRIETMAKGKLNISSTLNVGTSILISLPKEEK